jgi:hypothetical protein
MVVLRKGQAMWYVTSGDSPKAVDSRAYVELGKLFQIGRCPTCVRQQY